MKQEYPEGDCEKHFEAVLPAFKDKRYITVDGKPIFVIYAPMDIPNVTEYMNNNGDKILDAMGRTYTNEEFLAKLGDPNAPIADQKCISADAIADMYKV